MMRKKAAGILAAALTGFVMGLAALPYGAAGTVYAAENAGVHETAGLYDWSQGTDYGVFSNYVDGYRITLEKDMKVDFSMPAVCAVLENGSKRIEIFRQPFHGKINKAGYLAYSNKFAENRTDHTVDFIGYQNIGGKQVHVTSWSRSKLKGISGDKNYYVSLDLLSGNAAYTIFVKADRPLAELGGYAYLIEGFSVITPTRQALPFRTAFPDLSGRNWNEETRDFFGRYFSDNSPLTWGIFEPYTAHHTGMDYGPLKQLEDQIGYTFPISLDYSEFQDKTAHPNLKARLEAAHKNGKTLELTLQTNWSTEDGGNMVYDVLDGEYDGFLTDYAETIAAFGHPVLFRLGNEMNGDWCPYSGYHTSRDPMIFKEFYRYVHSFFKKAGARNVIWVWNPNGTSFPDFQWNHALMYYPGDDYVDVVGMTAYNTGTYYSSIGEKWEEFDALYAGLYRTYSETFGQPLMITEFASAETGGDKVQWVRNMFRSLPAYPRIKVAVWWDGCDWDPSNGNISRSYFIDEPYELLEVFRENLKRSWKESSYA